MDMRPAKCWGIKTRQGEIALPTLRTTKRKCIRDYMATPGNRKVVWRQLKRWGWDCVPVTVNEI